MTKIVYNFFSINTFILFNFFVINYGFRLINELKFLSKIERDISAGSVRIQKSGDTRRSA